jgi:hypothetical protein
MKYIMVLMFYLVMFSLVQKGRDTLKVNIINSKETEFNHDLLTSSLFSILGQLTP